MHIAQGVIIVCVSWQRGDDGMGFPGAYAPVISVVASGWVGEWLPAGNKTAGGTTVMWRIPQIRTHFYITDFSSRELTEQALDIAAPGSWVVGPNHVQQGRDLLLLPGRHLDVQPPCGRNSGVDGPEGETGPERIRKLRRSSPIVRSYPLGAGCRDVVPIPGQPAAEICWGADATGAGLLDAAAAVALTP